MVDFPSDLRDYFNEAEGVGVDSQLASSVLSLYLLRGVYDELVRVAGRDVAQEVLAAAIDDSRSAMGFPARLSEPERILRIVE